MLFIGDSITDCGRRAENGVGPELFEEVYDELLGRTQKELGCPVALLTPFYISTTELADEFQQQVLDLIPDCISTVFRMSEKYDTLLLDLHSLFAEHLIYRNAEAFCPEPVHPNSAGHTVIAQAVYDMMSA